MKYYYLFELFVLIAILSEISCLSLPKFTLNLKKIQSFSTSITCGIFLGISILSNNPQSSLANEIKTIGDIPTSGFFFKDSLKILSIQDPKIPQINLYLSDFDRPITEKLANNFFNDPSSSSLTCVQTSPIDRSKIKISDNMDGEEVFEESRNLFFKVFIYFNYIISFIL